MSLQKIYLSESMTQGGKEMMAARLQGKPERLNVRDALDQAYSKFFSSFGDSVSESTLTYHSELIEGDSAPGEKRLL